MHLQQHNMIYTLPLFLHVSSHPSFSFPMIFSMVSADPRYVTSAKVRH